MGLQGYSVGGEDGTPAFAAGGAGFEVVKQGSGGPGMVAFGVVEAALALRLRD